MKRKSIPYILAAVFVMLETMLFLYVDQPVSNYIRALNISDPTLIDVFRSYTDFAKAKWYLIPLGLSIGTIALMLRFRKVSKPKQKKLVDLGNKFSFLFCNILFSGILTNVLKIFIGRARPIMFEREQAYGFSFWSMQSTWHSMPSGHTTTAFALVFSLMALYPRLWPLWSVLGFAFGLSRIMVNAHYVSDVCAGACVAFLTLKLIEAGLKHYGMFHVKQCIFPIDKKPVSN